jgi:hypothetical protein
MAGSGPATALMSSVRLAAKQGRLGADWWAHTTVPGGGGLNTIEIQTNSNYFKSFQTLTDPKTAFNSLKNLK